jgi:hypothetical protein
VQARQEEIRWGVLGQVHQPGQFVELPHVEQGCSRSQ